MSIKYGIIFFGENMRNVILSVCSAAVSAYTIWYMSFGDVTVNSGALSKIGLRHPVLFAVWGVLTYVLLYMLIHTAYRKYTDYKFYHWLMAASGVGMLLTLCCDFDYTKRLQWFLHCAGSLTFSAVTGITVFLFFLLCAKRETFFMVIACLVGAVLIGDTVFLIIFKETALIEAVPIFIGYIVLNLTLYKKEANVLAVGQSA